MTAPDWALLVVFLAFLAALTYAVNRLLDEHAARRAYTQQMIDDAYWSDLMRAVMRARHDIDAGARR